MPWGWGGRGYRWMFWLTGLPGWARFGFGYPGWGSYFWSCRWFPWLPRWWWSGIYGPVTWTPQGPMLASQTTSTTRYLPTFPQAPLTKEEEIRYLEEELKALEEEKKMIERELEALRKRLGEIKK